MASNRPRNWIQPARLSRVTGALVYLGPLCLIVVSLPTRSRFIMRHALIAMTTHLFRFGLSGLLIGLWLYQGGSAHPARAATLAADLGMLLLTGLPWIPGMERELLYLLALPLGMTWIVSLAGVVIAASGHTIDFDALLHADWPDALPEPVVKGPNPAAERAYARELRERRLERIWDASIAAQTERRRGARIEQVQSDMDAVLRRLDHLNRLLSLGEISLPRFDAMHHDLIAYLDALRAELTGLQTRSSDARANGGLGAPASPPLALTDLPEVHALTLAVLDPGGVPIFTVGHFALDETLITGMVSALDSLSEEMFGSRVHKTQLAEGQVVHFVRGRLTIAFAIFEDEPAPAQIVELREFLDAFEQTNGALLMRGPLDPDQVVALPPPFTFLDREIEDDGRQRSAPLIGDDARSRR